MQLRWIGHASFKLKAGERIVYIDPYAGEPDDYREKADLILVSHNHYDHCSREKIQMAMGDDTHLVGSAAVAAEFNGCRPVGEDETIDFGWVKLTATPAYNLTKRFHPRGAAVGFIIELENKKIYFSSDTDAVPEMSRLKADIALVAVGGTYTMNGKEAVEAIKMIKPSIAIPMHWGKIVGTRDDAELFKELAGEQTGTSVRIAEPGEEITL